MKEGLILEDGELRFYRKGQLYHAGVIQHEDGIYYIDSHGRAVTGEHIVHGSMCNGILKKGTYTFDENGRVIKESYRAPRKHSKRRKTQIQKKKKFKIKDPRQALLGGLVVIAVLVALVWLVVSEMTPHEVVEGTEPTGQVHKADIVLPKFDEDVLLCSNAAKKAYDREIQLQDAIGQGDPYRPLLFKYRLANETGILHVSESNTFSDCREFILDQDKTSIYIDNLKADTYYRYKVTLGNEEYFGSFRTAKSNRFLSVPGVKNLRDIGGYKTLDGKIVKQGMLIRGVEIDGIKNPDYFILEEDLEEVQNTFKFVYDLDLRAPDIFVGAFQSRLGHQVGHKFYDAPGYAQIFLPENMSKMREIFTDLADPEKYPMYLHCTWGTDRTGTIIFLLQGILNVSEDDMLYEYRLTGYTTPSVATGDKMEALIWGLEAYEGDTLNEKIISYLTTAVGITQEQISAIQSIFLEE